MTSSGMGEVYRELMRSDTYGLTLDDLADMTDLQLVGLFTRGGGRASRKAREAAKLRATMTFRDSYIFDRCADDPRVTRDRALAEFEQHFGGAHG